MVKRQLTEEEKKRCSSQILNRQERNKFVDFQLNYYELMLNEGLEQNYREKLREFKKMREEFEKEKNTNEFVIKELQKQMREGVEVKEEDEKEKSERESKEVAN